MSTKIACLLPGYNCGECGYKSCRELAEKISCAADLTLCPILSQERFKENAATIIGLLGGKGHKECIRGVIDGLVADFALASLPGEPSCREDIYPFDRDAKIRVGDVLSYRPLGCPIKHFARVLRHEHGMATVHLVGPVHLLNGSKMPEDIGICLVSAFEGMVSRGRTPDVGETVSFLPEHCMMQKVHSGVVVHSEGSRVRIEGIDLKVWQRASNKIR
ncbi:MAG: Electron transport complex subunit RsxB [Methanosaeta sp. PtaU1.Bin060]|nr:MAG: Electron transport complex subunit RsxB [Methanosaeta sp. PtaU1.Bin060]